VNAIEHVIIPRTENTIKCMLAHLIMIPSLISPDINSELDELDREEFYRLKKVSGKKQRDQAAADAEIVKQRKAQKAGSNKENEAEPKDVLGEHEDDDIIF